MGSLQEQVCSVDFPHIFAHDYSFRVSHSELQGDVECRVYSIVASHIEEVIDLPLLLHGLFLLLAVDFNIKNLFHILLLELLKLLTS